MPLHVVGLYPCPSLFAWLQEHTRDSPLPHLLLTQGFKYVWPLLPRQLQVRVFVHGHAVLLES